MALDTTVGGASSDSYGTLAAFKSYAHFKGSKTTSTQALQWPRYVSGYVEGFAVPSDSIPQPIINAQFEAAWEILGGVDVFASIDGGAVKRKKEKVDVIEEETEYSTPQAAPFYPAVRGLIEPYIDGTRGMPALGSIPLARA